MKFIQPFIEVLTDISHESPILKRLELFGRVCYKSEAAITSMSAHKFVKRLIERGHESVLEHFSITVRFICDRGISHELVRHRLGSYSQESTRYVCYENGVTCILPDLVVPHRIALALSKALEAAEESYIKVSKMGLAPQYARCILPMALKTEVITTFNIRQWRHVLKLRTSASAHPQMRGLMVSLLKCFQAKLPTLFGDITFNSFPVSEVKVKLTCLK